MNTGGKKISSAAQGDEISLVVIALTFKRFWKRFIAVVAVFTLGALVLALVMPKKYKSEIMLLPPLQKDIEMMNVVPELYQVKSEDLYRDMLRNLGSNALRRQFFQERDLLAFLQDKKDAVPEQDVFQKKFNEMFTVDEQEAENNDLPVSVTVELQGEDPEKIALWLNEYVRFIDQFTVNSLLGTLDTILAVRVEDIQDKINSLLRTAEKRHADEILRMEEAALIAEKLGIEEQSVTPFYSYNHSLKSDPVKGITITSDHSTDYLKGYKALRAEMEALKKREDHKPFIDGLRDLEEELLYFESIQSKLVAGHAIRFDTEAPVPRQPFKPNLKLYLILGFCLGLMVAMSGVLGRSMLTDI